MLYANHIKTFLGKKTCQVRIGLIRLTIFIPIIAMTANVFKEDVDAAMEAGMSGFEGKPLDVEHLYLQICRLLGLEAGGLKSE